MASIDFRSDQGLTYNKGGNVLYHAQALSAYPLAKCLDGSPALYYFRKAATPESFFLYFENG